MEYKLIRKKRKTVGIKISECGEVLVYAPWKASASAVDDIVRAREKWISDAKSKMKNYSNGDSVIFLGKTYRFNFVKTFDKELEVKIQGADFTVYHGGDAGGGLYSDIKEYLYKHYKKDFHKIISSRIKILAGQIGVAPNKISIKNQRTIWGSCSGDNNISINFRLSLAHPDIIDYVLVHELCHIIHKNHSREFWSTVEAVMPDYRKKRDWLKASSYSALF